MTVAYEEFLYTTEKYSLPDNLFILDEGNGFSVGKKYDALTIEITKMTEARFTNITDHRFE